MASAAVEVFWQKGYPSATIQDVAEHVGVLKGSLYHYIASKEDLLWEIMQVAHEQATAVIEEVSALEGTPLERLHAYVERIALWFLEDPKQLTVALRDWHHLTDERRAIVDQRRRSYERGLREMIAQARPSRSRRYDRFVRYMAHYVQATFNGMPEWYYPEDEVPSELVARTYADMAVGILLATVESDAAVAR